MSIKLKHIFLPAAAIGLLIVGMEGLKETVYSAVHAANGSGIPAYFELDETADPGANINNEVRISSPNDLGPSFTFLVHGIGGDASHWSNDLRFSPNSSDSDEYGIIGNDGFAWNNTSLVRRISQGRLSQVAIYKAEYCNNNRFILRRQVEQTNNGIVSYREDNQKRNRLTDTCFHNVVVYESDDSYQSLAAEYQHFERVVNTLCYDYKLLHGFAPKINLIGHSRGGLVIQKYVNNYPYNVSNYFNIATPHLGTESLAMYDSLKDLVSSQMPSLLDSEDGQELFRFEGPAYDDLRDTDLLNSLKTRWFELKTSSNLPDLLLEGTNYSGVMTLPYIRRLITNAQDKVYEMMGDEDGGYVINRALQMIDSLNALCVKQNVTDPIDMSQIMGYTDYQNACHKGEFELGWEEPTSTIRQTMTSIVNSAFHDIAYRIEALKQISSVKDIPVIGWAARFFAHIGVSMALSDFQSEFTPLIVNSISSFNGQVGVFNNDLFVDLKSGACDDFYYWGQNRYVRIFEFNDAQYNSIKPTIRELIVGHNVETQDSKITAHIMTKCDFPTYDELHRTTDCEEDMEYTSLSNNIPLNEDVKRLTINGDTLGGGVLNYNPCITIDPRPNGKPLTIKLVNFKTTLNSESTNVTEPFIKYTGRKEFTLTIEYEGENYFKYNTTYKRSAEDMKSPVIDCAYANIEFKPRERDNTSLYLQAANGANGENGAKGADGGVKNRNGQPGISGEYGYTGAVGSTCVECHNIDFRLARNLTLKGGNGGNGGRGGNGGNGGGGKSLTNGFKGGDGGNGGEGGRGGDGGNGGYAFHCSRATIGDTYFARNAINLCPGKPGNGGRGGNGGNGGHGANGSSWFGKNHNGGNGGNGGIVGRGGSSGRSYFNGASITTSDIYTNRYYSEWRSSLGYYFAASGGLSGSKFGDGGNAGRRSGASKTDHTPITGDGTPGKAVTSRTGINGLISGMDDLIVGSKFRLNGSGIDTNGDLVYYATQPTYGKEGIVNYNYVS